MFKKGQHVHYINKWSQKCDATWRRAVVYSCGKKRMVLTDADTGEEMGRQFKPEEDQWGAFVKAGLTDAEAAEFALEASQGYIDKELAHYRAIIERPGFKLNSRGYQDSIRKGYEESKLYRPAAYEFSVAREANRKKVWG